jgi:poly(glycerol-phosphate) alpha-glucosyltransferase
LLYLGRLHPKKNIDGLLRGWARASATDVPDWWLVIAGWGENGHEKELRELVGSLCIPRVVFVGPQFGSQRSATFHRVDAFILTSHSEGLPVTVLEALAHRLPVVMTRECNVPEALKVGAAVEVGPEPESIGEGVSRLAHFSEATRQMMGRAGRRLVEEQFVWSIVSRQFLAVYRWALGQDERPACVVDV